MAIDRLKANGFIENSRVHVLEQSLAEVEAEMSS